MKKNMGSTNKLVRFSLVIVVAVLVYFKVVEGTFTYVLMTAGVLYYPAWLVFDLLRSIFGLSTCPVKGKE